MMRIEFVARAWNFRASRLQVWPPRSRPVIGVSLGGNQAVWNATVISN